MEQFPEQHRYAPLFFKAYEEAGLVETDYNNGNPFGIAHKQFTNVHGSRLSGNGAFIRIIRDKRSNLVVKPNHRVTRIIIDEMTKRAIGVEYEDNNKMKGRVFARKEVILSAGFVETPKLLMLSGIGPKNHLQQFNIKVLKDLPVGLNLHDHFTAELHLTSNNTPLNKSEQMIKADLFEWINTHEGAESRRLELVEVEAFYRTKFENRVNSVDIQYEINGYPQADRTIGNFTITAIILKPNSRGFIKLNSSDPVNNQPMIRLNPLSDSQDVEVLLEGLKFILKLANTETLKNAGLTLSKTPILQCRGKRIYSDDYLRCLIKETVGTFIHGVGTCKMGPKTDVNAVVDSKLKVYGLNGLRVIDASIMPQSIEGNPMGAVYMIGEKGSDIIKKDHLGVEY